MLLFNKKDMLVICKYDGNEVTFSKSLKEILKYQYKYNYKFKLYATGGEFVGTFIADDYCIDGENLTIFIGDYIVEYNSSGTSIETVTGGSGGEGGEGDEGVLQIVEVSDTVNLKEKQGDVYFYDGTQWINYTATIGGIDEIDITTNIPEFVGGLLYDAGFITYPSVTYEMLYSTDVIPPIPSNSDTGWYVTGATKYLGFTETIAGTEVYHVILENGDVLWYETES